MASVGYNHLVKEIDNPTPQLENPCNQFLRTNGDAYILVMVGLPGRGKTFIARSLCRYLTFIQRARCEVFNIGNYRRKMVGVTCTSDFFDPENEVTSKQSEECFHAALKDLKNWYNTVPVEGQNAAKVAILDGFNGTRKERKYIFNNLNPIVETGSHIIFIESIIDEAVDNENAKAIEFHIEMAMRHMPDYKDMDKKIARKDFRKRMEMKQSVYQEIDGSERHYSWVKIGDAGRQFTMNRIHGFIPGKMLQFLMNLRISTSRPIYLSRHGESEYNVLGKIGGDSKLSEEGEEYAVALATFVHTDILGLNEDGSFKDPETRVAPHCRLFTSSLRRTRDTARHIVHHRCDDGWVIMRPSEERSLDEIYAGVFDGMTMDEIEKKAPEEFRARKLDKLEYRYPRGESYLDVVKRLDHIIHEVGRLTDPVLIIAHQGILRIIYSYFMGHTLEEAPKVPIPLNTVFKLQTSAYVCSEERIVLLGKDGGVTEPPSH